MSIDSHILKPLKFFADFKQHELEAWAESLKSRSVEAGEVITVDARAESDAFVDQALADGALETLNPIELANALESLEQALLDKASAASE